MGLEVEERPLAIDALGYRDELIKVGDGSVGPWTQKLHDALTGIQYGRQPDPFGWMQRL